MVKYRVVPIERFILFLAALCFLYLPLALGSIGISKEKILIYLCE
jgi:hypothetical protein